MLINTSYVSEESTYRNKTIYKSFDLLEIDKDVKRKSLNKIT